MAIVKVVVLERVLEIAEHLVPAAAEAVVKAVVVVVVGVAVLVKLSAENAPLVVAQLVVKAVKVAAGALVLVQAVALVALDAKEVAPPLVRLVVLAGVLGVLPHALVGVMGLAPQLAQTVAEEHVRMFAQAVARDIVMLSVKDAKAVMGVHLAVLVTISVLDATMFAVVFVK